jgi:phospholipid/cholesterol/gamma-HCH transport system substrate-binding protein
MDKEVVRNIKLGIFVIVGAVLLIVGLYFIGSNKNMFGRTIKLYTTFKNVSGLQSGNNVRYAGIDIGTVEDIVIVNDTTIRIEMSVKPDLKNVIRNNSKTSLGNDGLMGNKIINIDPGTSDAPLINEGDELISIRVLDAEEMLRTLENTNQNVEVISSNLKDITGNINKSKGTLYTVLMDTTLSSSLRHTIYNIETTTENLNGITNDLAEILTGIKQGKGLLGTLIKDTTITKDLQESISLVKSGSEQINSSAAELKITLHKINSGSGTAGTLLNDTATANQLKRSMINIENGTRNFNENMEALKQSTLLRGYFKKQEKLNKQNQ